MVTSSFNEGQLKETILYIIMEIWMDKNWKSALICLKRLRIVFPFDPMISF